MPYDVIQLLNVILYARFTVVMQSVYVSLLATVPVLNIAKHGNAGAGTAMIRCCR